MSLLESRAQSAAQPIQFFIDPSHISQSEPLEVSDESHENDTRYIKPEEFNDLIEAHENLNNEPQEMHGDLEVSDSEPIIELGFVPGAKGAEKDPEPPATIEVSEHDDKADVVDEESSKKNEKWDWAKNGPKDFLNWIKSRCDEVPTHSGYDSAGISRAIAYLERLDNEVSKAMRMDLDGELDANQIEKARAIIDNGIERLNDRLDKVKSSKKKSRNKKSDYQPGLVKEGQKITGVQGIFVTVPLLISRIARVCIRSDGVWWTQSQYARQVKFYKLDTREQAEVMQLLFDMGFAVRQDRGFMPDQEIDTRSSDNFDWMANYSS